MRQLNPEIDARALVALLKRTSRSCGKGGLSLPPDGIVDVRRCSRRLRGQFVGKAPLQMIGIAGARSRMAFDTCDRRPELRPSHDGHSDGPDSCLADGAKYSRDEIAIDVAVTLAGRW